MAFDAVIKFRAELELEARLLRLVRQPENRGRDFAAICRIAMEDYCTAEEKRLHMKPITNEEIDESLAMVMAERRARAPITPRPSKHPVNYRDHKPRKKSS